MVDADTPGVTLRQDVRYTRRHQILRRMRQACRMGARRTYRPTYLRAWRNHRGLSLRQLAARMEGAPGEELISHVSLGRIETGKQPYSQPILEAAAKALNVTAAMLLDADPEKDGEIIELVHRLSPEKRRQAKAILEAFSKAS